MWVICSSYPKRPQGGIDYSHDSYSELVNLDLCSQICIEKEYGKVSIAPDDIPLWYGVIAHPNYVGLGAYRSLDEAKDAITRLYGALATKVGLFTMPDSTAL